MRRRLILLLAATLAALGSFGVSSAQADTVPEAEPGSVETVSSGYWACVAFNVVDVGACLDNPLPDASGLPSVRQVVYDATGVNV